jgi:hypothetical protein
MLVNALKTFLVCFLPTKYYTVSRNEKNSSKDSVVSQFEISAAALVVSQFEI